MKDIKIDMKKYLDKTSIDSMVHFVIVWHIRFHIQVIQHTYSVYMKENCIAICDIEMKC